MSSSTPLHPLLLVGQAGKETQINGLFSAASPAMLFARDELSCFGLTVKLFGGRFNGADLANQTITLTASSTNFIEADTAGVAHVRTDGFTTGRLPLYQIAVGATTATSWTDCRQIIGVAVEGAGTSGVSLVVPNPRAGDYTLTLADLGGDVVVTAAGTSTVTVPPQADVAWPIGAVMYVSQGGAGAVTIAGGAGVTLVSAYGLSTTAQHDVRGIQRLGVDSWRIV